MSSDSAAGGNSLFKDFRDNMVEAIDQCVSKLESEHAKLHRAWFEALYPDQRDRAVQSMKEQGIKPRRIEKITGKSQSTINRHLNGKNS